ncbi:MAG: hypothetical protein AB7U34_00710 [Novosphingobium sp.]
MAEEKDPTRWWKIGKSAFEFLVRTGELLALSVFFQVAGLLSGSTVVEALAIIFRALTLVYVSASLGYATHGALLEFTFGKKVYRYLSPLVFALYLWGTFLLGQSLDDAVDSMAIGEIGCVQP